jgi:hypothetical protein
MTTILPTLELKYNKETISNSTNTNTINNDIIIKPTSDDTFKNIEEILNIGLNYKLEIKKSDTP